MNDNLLYTETDRPKKRVAILRWFIFVSVCLGVGLVGWFVQMHFSSKDIDPTVQFIDEQKKNYEEAIRAGERLSNFYKLESAPVQSKDQNPIDFEDNLSDSEEVSGSLVFSSVLKNHSLVSYLQEHILDLKESEQKPRPIYPQYQFSAMAEFTGTQSSEKIFIKATSSASLQSEGDQAGIHLFDPLKNELTYLKSAGGFNERNLAWSPASELLAFNRARVTQELYVDLLSLESWELVVINPQNDSLELVIDNAYQPKWSPKGDKLVYLKTDGLYVFDLTSQTESKLVSVPKTGMVVATSMIDLSKDATLLLWTTAKAGIITFYKVSSWDDVRVEEVGRLQIPETEVYWPQFSPDGSQYAVQAIDTLKQDEEERQNPRIEIRPINGRNPVFTHSLSDFDFDRLFTDAWIE